MRDYCIFIIVLSTRKIVISQVFNEIIFILIEIKIKKVLENEISKELKEHDRLNKNDDENCIKVLYHGS